MEVEKKLKEFLDGRAAEGRVKKSNSGRLSRKKGGGGDTEEEKEEEEVEKGLRQVEGETNGEGGRDDSRG